MSDNYRFIPNPKPWDRSCHRYPCPETDHIDDVLNELESRTVHLTPEQIQFCKRLGHRRNHAKHPSWTRRQSDVFSDSEVDFLGVVGEFAVASFLHVKLDQSITTSGDKGHDLSYKGLTVAVKFNHRCWGYLMVEHRKSDDWWKEKLYDFTADLIILTYGRCNPPKNCHCRNPDRFDVVVAGFLTHKDFFKRALRKDLGLGGRYIVKCDNLRPMQELEQCAEKEFTKNPVDTTRPPVR